jgi:hypothetical protein
MKGSAPAHLRNVISSIDEAPADDDRGLPSLADGTYRAFSRASNKPLYALHFISPQGLVRSFQYMHLDSDSSFNPEHIALRFTGVSIVNVVITGRNLWELYDYIHQHRTAWVRQAARDFGADGEAIITGITIIAMNDEAGRPL